MEYLITEKFLILQMGNFYHNKWVKENEILYYIVL